MAVTSAVEAEKLTQELANIKTPDWKNVDELKEMNYVVESEVPGKRRQILNFEQSVLMIKTLEEEVKVRQTRIDDIHEAVQAALLLSGEKRVRVGDYVPQMVERKGNKKIVPEKLLAAGVSPQIIAEATEIGKSSTFMTIKKEEKKG